MNGLSINYVHIQDKVGQKNLMSVIEAPHNTEYLKDEENTLVSLMPEYQSGVQTCELLITTPVSRPNTCWVTVVWVI